MRHFHGFDIADHSSPACRVASGHGRAREKASNETTRTRRPNAAGQALVANFAGLDDREIDQCGWS
jgi:hypothetical protein